jgi:predicted dehydrogenase
VNRVVLVGAGSWGAKLAARLVKPDVPFMLAGVVDQNHTRAEALAHASGCGWYGAHNLEAAARWTDWAIVAIPPGDERQVVCEELRALGVYNIRVEKPLVEDPQYVDTVGHQTLFAPEGRLFAEIVRAGRVARWESYRSSSRPSGWGPWVDLAVHDIAFRMWVDSRIVGEHRAEYTAPGVMPERWTRVEFEHGPAVTLDEARRVVGWGKARVAFAGTPDPLGVELRAWARGETVDLGLAKDAADEALDLAGRAA